MANIFTLGTTGYVGAHATYALSQKHPEYIITCLVRTPEKGKLIAASIPNVKLVYGDFESYDLLREEAAKADVVINWAASNNERAVKAIFKGISSKASPGFYIHTTGSSILSGPERISKTYGKESDIVYDDMAGVSRVKNLEKEAFIWHPEDLFVWSGGNGTNLRTALVCPPAIYGENRGPAAENSIMISLLARLILERGYGLTVGEGKGRWNGVHVHDLSNIYIRLVEEAVRGGGSATWDADGFYFAEAGEFVWREISAEITRVAYEQGFINSPSEIKSIDPANAETELHPYALTLWAMNSRSKALRARKCLGWQPAMLSLIEDIPRVVQAEAVKLGLKK